MTHEKLLIAALVAQVALTFILLFWLGPARVGALRRGEVRLKDVALGQDAWPPRISQIGRAYQNQHEMPVLLYVLVLLALVMRKADLVLIVAAWGFVVTRYVHAFVHTTSNDVGWRFRSFVLGVAILLAAWAWLAVGLLTMP